MSVVDCHFSPLNWLEISGWLNEKQRLLIKQYALVDVIGSTNDWALRCCDGITEGASVCFAEQQSHGRGRSGRSWVSPKGQNIYMSLAWVFNQPVAELNHLSLVVGVVIADLLKRYGLDVSLKWPNDIWVEGRKIAGILIETRVKGKARVCAVMGVGLNYAMHDRVATGIDQPWIDVCRALKPKQAMSRNQLAGALLAALLTACDAYAARGFADFAAAWWEYDVCRDRLLEIRHHDQIYQGVGLGINTQGGLKALIDGCERVFYAADVSVKVDD